MSEQEQKQESTAEELLSYLYPKAFKCPVCTQEFNNFIVRRNRLRLVKTDIDFRSYYKVIDPNDYEVVLCTHCGYAALSSYFDKILNKQKALIKEKITPNYTPAIHEVPLSKQDVLTRFTMAIQCAKAMGVKVSQESFIYMKVAWFYRGLEDTKNEKVFLRAAYKGLKTAFSEEGFPIGNMDEPTTRLILGDFARRLGEFEESLRWIGEVVINPAVTHVIKERAQMVKELAREEDPS